MSLSVAAAPLIDPIPAVDISTARSLIVPVTATSPTGRPLTFSASSSTNRIQVEVETNNPFWKMSVVQAAPANAPGAYSTPFRGGTVTVTNMGDMTFMLFRAWAPHTVDVIQGLTDSGFYTTNTIFHRVVPGFVIQGGDPDTNGMGGLVFQYDDEYYPKALFTGNGQLALANSGKDTDGSQFFVTVGPQRALDFNYTIFGQLLRGFDVLTNINNVATNGASRPLADVIIATTSLVPDTSDTVLTLTASNVAGISGTISVIADDGAGGRATNKFTATTITNTVNDPPFLYPQTVTNLVAPLNTRLTNTVTQLDLDGDANYWFIEPLDQYSTNSFFIVTNAQMRLVVVPNANFRGSTSVSVAVAVYELFPYIGGPYDSQTYTFAFGDTPITARAADFVAPPLTTFSNQLLATFTNGVLNSPPSDFTAFINWGDDMTNSGVIGTNATGWKEVLGSHSYANGGDYPIYITIQSSSGASSTVVCTAAIPPSVSFTLSGTNGIVSWPAWAIPYQLQTKSNLAQANWAAVTNYSALAGFESVVTNGATNGSAFYRLSR